MKEKYFDIIMMTERLHRLFLEVLKKELDRYKMADISSVQCLIIYNIGDTKLTVGEISNRGYYLGSNVTYNLKKMVESGYLLQNQSLHDKRSSYVILSPRGQEIYQIVENLIERQLGLLASYQISPEDLAQIHNTLRLLEHFWSFLSAKEGRF